MSRTTERPTAESRARLAAHAGVLLVLAIGILTFAADGHAASASGFVLAFALALFAARSDLRSSAPAAGDAVVSAPVDAAAQREAWAELYAVVTSELTPQVDAAATSTAKPESQWNGYSSATSGYEGTALAVVSLDAEAIEDRDRRRAEIEQVVQTSMRAGYLAARAGWTSAPTTRVRWTEHETPVVEFLQNRRTARGAE